MAGIRDTSLEAKIAEIEDQLRALRARNILDLAYVVGADGASVPLSSIAFGQAAAAQAQSVEINGTPDTVGGAGWFSGDPSVNVLVNGGRLRVDIAASLVATGNKCSMFMSYAVLGPVSTPNTTAGQVVVEAAYDRAIEVQHNGLGMDQRASMGTFGLHTGLAPGWYTIASRYALSYSSSAAPYGAATNRRIAATPY